MTKLSTLFLALVLFAAPISAQKSDLTGQWAVDVQTDAGSGSPVFVLKQVDDKLTGTYKGTLGEANVTGTVTGKTFKITFNIDAQGTALAVVYDGEIDSSDAIKGRVDLGGLGSGTFTGKRSK